MLGNRPNLPHGVMRWLIITLMLINGGQLVLLQLTINSTLALDYGPVWLYVAISGAALLLALALIAYAFVRGRDTNIRVLPSTPQQQGTVAEPSELKSKNREESSR